jgi:hypothetical protein
LGNFPAQAIADEAFRQLQEKVASHGREGTLDVEAVFEDAVKDGGANAVVVVGPGRDIQRPGAEVLATGAARFEFGMVNIEVGHSLVGQGMSVKTADIFFAWRRRLPARWIYAAVRHATVRAYLPKGTRATRKPTLTFRLAGAAMKR